MPINEYGMNNDYVEYFPLEEYVNRIELLPNTLEHLEYTSKSFNEYINKLSSYNEDYIVDYWIYLLYHELKFNQQIEHINKESSLVSNNVFFDSLAISNKRIHELHNFIVKGEYEPSFEYRSSDVRVSRFRSDGSEDIFWRGVNYQDVDKFMSDFIKNALIEMLNFKINFTTLIFFIIILVEQQD